MPDHAHFFASPQSNTPRTLSSFVGFWKRSTAKRLRRAEPAFSWQAEFFDHLVRNAESYAQKQQYVFENPVRKGLVERPEEWSYQGEIQSLRW